MRRKAVRDDHLSESDGTERRSDPHEYYFTELHLWNSGELFFHDDAGRYCHPIILACDTIYGSMNINSIVCYAQKLGYNVLGDEYRFLFHVYGRAAGHRHRKRRIQMQSGGVSFRSLSTLRECVCSGKHGGADQDDKSGRGRKRIRRFPR